MSRPLLYLWCAECYIDGRSVGRRKRSVLSTGLFAAPSRLSYLAGHHAGLFHFGSESKASRLVTQGVLSWVCACM